VFELFVCFAPRPTAPELYNRELRGRIAAVIAEEDAGRYCQSAYEKAAPYLVMSWLLGQSLAK
jgi:hypothetical protein